MLAIIGRNITDRLIDFLCGCYGGLLVQPYSGRIKHPASSKFSFYFTTSISPKLSRHKVKQLTFVDEITRLTLFLPQLISRASKSDFKEPNNK